MTMTKESRQSNIELLRIFSMFAIVIYHVICGGIMFYNSNYAINNMWGLYLHPYGETGVWIFVIITGYFLINSKKFNYVKLVRFCLQCLFYSCIIYVVFFIYKKPSYNKKNLRNALLPITSGTWWFASEYILVYIFSPFFNKFLNVLTRKEYKLFLFICGFLGVLLPTSIGKSIGSFTNGFCMLLYMYALGAYFKKYASEFKIKKITCLMLALIISVLTVPVQYLYMRLNLDGKFLFFGIVWNITHISSIFVMFMAIFFFLFFTKINIGHISIINFFSKATFGVYLLHVHPIILDLWKKIFRKEYFYKLYFIPYTICFAFAMYAVCTIVELFRIHAVESLYMKLVIKVLPGIKKILKSVYNKITRFY